MKKGKLGAILLALVLIIGLVCCVVCLEKIPAGYVGVVYNMNGGVDGEVLEQGWHLVAPTKKVTKYSIGIEQSYLTAEDKGDSPKDESFNIPTSDGKTVRVNIEFSYRFDEARVSETFAMFKGKSGEAIKDSFIKPKVVAWTQEVSANYPVTDIFGDKRTEINAELDTYLREKRLRLSRRKSLLSRSLSWRILKSKPPRFRLRKTERSHRLTQRKRLLKQKQKQRHCVLLRRQKLTQTARLRLHLPMS